MLNPRMVDLRRSKPLDLQKQHFTTFLKNKKLWCHAKNIEALFEMLEHEVHCFWHQEDDVSLTSKGYIWTYPLKPLTSQSICVQPELYNANFNHCLGVCSDFISEYR